MSGIGRRKRRRTSGISGSWMSAATLELQRGQTWQSIKSASTGSNNLTHSPRSSLPRPRPPHHTMNAAVSVHPVPPPPPFISTHITQHFPHLPRSRDPSSYSSHATMPQFTNLAFSLGAMQRKSCCFKHSSRESVKLTTPPSLQSPSVSRLKTQSS
jgi:hypothetical protein